MYCVVSLAYKRLSTSIAKLNFCKSLRANLLAFFFYRVYYEYNKLKMVYMFYLAQRTRIAIQRGN